MAGVSYRVLRTDSYVYSLSIRKPVFRGGLPPFLGPSSVWFPPTIRLERAEAATGKATSPNLGRPPKKHKKPAQEEAGFLLRVFLRGRRYAELSYLLPFPIGPAVKTRCIGPSSWLASYR